MAPSLFTATQADTEQESTKVGFAVLQEVVKFLLVTLGMRPRTPDVSQASEKFTSA